MKDNDYIIATQKMQQGGIIGYPTEAVWGFGCDPWNEKAVYRLLRLKNRPVCKGLIIVAASIDQITPLMAPLSQQHRENVGAIRMRPTTWLIPDIQNWVPDFIKGEHKTVAVRISQHPVVRKLCQTMGKPITSTSANLAGEPAITKQADIESYFSAKLDMILLGRVGRESLPSAIIDLVSGANIR